MNSAVNLIKHIDKNIEDFKNKVTDVLQMNDLEYEKFRAKGKKEFEHLTKIANEIINYEADINPTGARPHIRRGASERKLATIFLDRLESTQYKQAIINQKLDPRDEELKDFIKLINTIKKIHKKLDKTQKISENIRKPKIRIRVNRGKII